MRRRFPVLTGRKSGPALVALTFYLLAGSVAAASLVLSPGKRARTGAPAPTVAKQATSSQSRAVESCPVTGQEPGVNQVQLASFVQQEAPKEAPAASAASVHPEGEGSESCLTCHGDVEPSHVINREVTSSTGTCVSCHGGNGKKVLNAEGKFNPDKKLYHVQPRFPEAWGKIEKLKRIDGFDGKEGPKIKTGYPERTYALLNAESADFIRFINPGDLRVADLTCGAGGCHGSYVRNVRKSMMLHGGMLYGAALYNNGVVPIKDAVFGEAYSSAITRDKDGKPVLNPHAPHSLPVRLQGVPDSQAPGGVRLPNAEELARGVLPVLFPLPRWNITQTGNVFRQFERGGITKPPQSEVGNPSPDEDPGKPDDKLSSRGHGSVLRTDPQVLGAQKTRLLDPTLNFLGTNDHPGDYRASGCSSCHNVYANDRDPVHSAHYAKYGNRGQSFTQDGALDGSEQDPEKPEAAAKGESGHPINHSMVRTMIPTSQCIVCHIHPGTNMLSTYLGYTWWDNETDAGVMYPPKPKSYSNHERDRIQQSNPDGAALRGLWGDQKFLADVTDQNPKLKHSQFADFHGHGWVFRGVYKRDRKGNLLDKNNKTIAQGDFKNAVHLKDIHLEKGMHCVDCHFSQDNHGNGKLYAEPRAATEITCTDCHGSIEKRATLLDDDGTPSGPAGGRATFSDYNFVKYGIGEKDTDGNEARPKRWYKKEDGSIWQRSAVTKGMEWPVLQLVDLVDPKSKSYNPKAALAKTVRRDGRTWGTVPAADQAAAGSARLAHDNSSMTCATCHTSWTTSCFGCHLSMTANNKKKNQHYEGTYSRNWISYNFQTLRDDMYMLGKDGVNTGNKTSPVRSSCAVLVSSQNQNRNWIYYQQQTTSAEGYAATAFSTYVPHTVRGKETKQCTDCHLSDRNDNNAWISNLLLQGSNAVNHIGHFAWVANEDGITAVKVAERDEPASVIGSYLHRLAYPDRYQNHQERGRKLKVGFDHHGRALQAQLRGEYLYCAEGSHGTVVYDVAQIDNKNFSERIVTAPVSPLGQRFYVPSRYAVQVALPSTMLIDAGRAQFPGNKEQKPIHPLYKYMYILDRYEGLIVSDTLTTMNGNPTDNFLTRAKLGNGQKSWNPDGILANGTSIQVAGRWLYITCDRGLVIVDINNPTSPRVARVIEGLHHPHSVTVQFRYAFVTDSEGMHVVDVTDPEKAAIVKGAEVKLADAHEVYVARTYAYVANGKHGLAIIDVENPERPKLFTMFSANGQINDAHGVKIGMTVNSLYAYVADGENGLRVIQLTSPDRTPGIHGYSPEPSPELIATYQTPGPALSVSEGLDRDRASDESGNQVSVFGRKGARPFNLQEQRAMYMRNGNLFKVSDEAPSRPNYAEAAPHSRNRIAWTDAFFLLPAALVGLARRQRRGWVRLFRGGVRRGWVLLFRRK